MSATIEESGEQPPPAWVGPARLVVGLLQGLAFYGISRADNAGWWKDCPALFYALCLVAPFAPLILLGGFGHLRRTTLVVWTLAAAAVLAGVGAYAGSNIVLTKDAYGPRGPDFALMLACAMAVFIAHHLVQGWSEERRLAARYPAYFDTAWKHGVQLVLACAFTGVFWAMLWLGAELFSLIGIKAVRELLQKEWFHDPAIGLAFAMAVHLTDVRAALTKGARTLGLTLLSWLTPIMALIAVAFLVALPFTGLKPLWDTKAAAAVLLGASAVLIVLINACYQDGERENGPHLVLRWAARIAALALTPLTALAAYAVWLRIAQYGLTPERVMGAALSLLSAGYAIGYGLAAVLPGAWMKPLERTNVVNAYVALGLFLAIFTPIADPQRLAAGDQVARLLRGAISPDRFDYDFLRFESGRYGLDALKRLKASHDAKIAKGADIALKRDFPLPKNYGDYVPDDAAKKKITVYPAGTALPADFESQTHAVNECLSTCDAYLADLDGDGSPEVLLDRNLNIYVYARDAARGWTRVGELLPMDCKQATDALKAGRFTTTQPSKWRDLEAGGVHLSFEPAAADCPTPRAPVAAAPTER